MSARRKHRSNSNSFENEVDEEAGSPPLSPQPLPQALSPFPPSSGTSQVNDRSSSNNNNFPKLVAMVMLLMVMFLVQNKQPFNELMSTQPSTTVHLPQLPGSESMFIGSVEEVTKKLAMEREVLLSTSTKTKVSFAPDANANTETPPQPLHQVKPPPPPTPPPPPPPPPQISPPTSQFPVYKDYTFWSSDFHISPIADLKDIFSQLDMNIIDKSLSGHCNKGPNEKKPTCAKDLKILDKGNGIDLGTTKGLCPNNLKKRFYDAYINDPQMNTVDAFLCHHASPMCEVFMSFGRPLIVVVSTRYEIGRYDTQSWTVWNDNLRAIALNPR